MNFFGSCFSKEEVKEEVKTKPVFKIDTEDERALASYKVKRGDLLLGNIVHYDGEWGWEGSVDDRRTYHFNYCPRIEPGEFQAIANKIHQLNLENKS